MVNAATVETVELSHNLAKLKDQLDFLMQKLMSNERKWETIMMMQVKPRNKYRLVKIKVFFFFLELLLSHDVAPLALRKRLDPSE